MPPSSEGGIFLLSILSVRLALLCYTYYMKSYIVGNWKMNLSVGDSSVYLHKLLQRTRAYRDVEVIVAPSVVALQPLSLQTDRKKIRLAAQTANPHDFGPYTGEVSCTQLRGLVDYCLVGHPDRRELFHESDRRIRDTVAAAVRNQITPILSLGETATEHTFGESRDVIADQLLGGLANVSIEDLDKVIIAYEPVWAISTTTDAHLASPEDVAETVKYLRTILADTYNAEVAANMPILYGGSVTPASAGAYLTIPGVNGIVIGEASLIADHFIDIIEIAKRVIS